MSLRTSWERAEAVAGAVVWCVLVISLSVVLLTSPSVTRGLERALDIPADTGLSQDDALEAAESVRAFVTSARPRGLPDTIAGRPAFDEAASSHLLDVRGALAATRIVSGLCAALLAVWMGFCVARARWDAVARVTAAGGWTTLGTIAAVVLFALVGFDRAFSAFHGVLFAEDSWLFPADSLLIQLFPERFWVSIGSLGALFAALMGAVLVIAAHRARTRGDG